MIYKTICRLLQNVHQEEGPYQKEILKMTMNSLLRLTLYKSLGLQKLIQNLKSMNFFKLNLYKILSFKIVIY